MKRKEGKEEEKDKKGNMKIAKCYNKDKIWFIRYGKPFYSHNIPDRYMKASKLSWWHRIKQGKESFVLDEIARESKSSTIRLLKKISMLLGSVFLKSLTVTNFRISMQNSIHRAFMHESMRIQSHEFSSNHDI